MHDTSFNHNHNHNHNNTNINKSSEPAGVDMRVAEESVDGSVAEQAGVHNVIVMRVAEKEGLWWSAAE